MAIIAQNCNQAHFTNLQLIRGRFHQNVYAQLLSIKMQSFCQYLFALMGSGQVKAAHKMLMKLTTSVNFINIQHARFLNKILAPRITKLCFGFVTREKLLNLLSHEKCTRIKC